jgi:hypothetical protein
MEEINEQLKKTVLDILASAADYETKIVSINKLMMPLNPARDGNELMFLCDAGIFCAQKASRTEMLAQLYLMKSKVEVAKAIFLVRQMKDFTMNLDWFGFTLKQERDGYTDLDERTQKIWQTMQAYINEGFKYLNQKPYVSATIYCYKIAAESYGSYALQLSLYHMKSKRPWRARLANYKITRFLDLDDMFLFDISSRKRIHNARRECFDCLKEAVKYAKQEDDHDSLADCYLTLALEHHSFNNPIRSKLFLCKARRLIKKYGLDRLIDQMEGIKNLPLIGSNGK